MKFSAQSHASIASSFGKQLINLLRMEREQ